MGDYALGIKELDDAIDGIRRGTNIILIGPPMSQKKVIQLNIMCNGAVNDENAIIMVTTHDPAIQILDWFKENNLLLPLSRIGIIDSTSKSIVGTAVENQNIKLAGSPVDLTGMGVRIGQFLEDFQMKKNIRKIQLHINSLSTILMYSNIHTVFRFLHVFTGRIRAAGALGIFVMESDMHDEQSKTSLVHLFDGVIEIKSEDDRDYIRIIGLSSKPTPWFEYEIEGANLRIKGKK